MADGLTSRLSPVGAKETMDRLDAAVKGKGMQVFARVDHSAGATAVGLTLRPTLMMIFGHPKGGTPLMQANQTIGIDLPMRALVHEDAEGKVWFSYNDPNWLAERHAIAIDAAPAVKAMAEMLRALASEVTRGPDE